jgi:hypothetical protein
VSIKDALSVVEKLNTQQRRDEALLGVVESAIKVPVGKMDLKSLQGVISEGG